MRKHVVSAVLLSFFLAGGLVTAQTTLTEIYADVFTLPRTVNNGAERLPGVIYQGDKWIFHTFAGLSTDGFNTFVGEDAGNFTMGTDEPAFPFRGSYNTGIGRAALQANTVGFDNVAVGESTLKANTEGTLNTGIGTGAMPYNTSGYFNTAVGGFALWSNVTGTGNTVLGFAAGYTNDPANANVSGNDNVWMGMEAGPGTTEQLSNSIAVGYRSHATASNQAVFGNPEITTTQLYGTVDVSGQGLSVTKGGTTKAGVTVSGSSCTITEITGGIITGATCTP